ncbi:hypothetical protein [Thermaurantiacus sp.]
MPLALLLPVAPLLAQVAPAGPGQTSSVPPAESATTRKGPPAPGQAKQEEPAEAVEPVGPVQPVRTFEPVPLPGGVEPSPASTPAASAPALPAPPVAAEIVRGGAPNPIVPGAAEAGYVVADTRSLYGRDFIPETGAAVIAAAGFRASTGLQASYSSNLFFIPKGEDEPQGTGSSRDDWILRPDLNLGLGRQVGRQLFFFNTVLGRDFFIRNEGRGQNRIALDGGVEWRLAASCAGRVQGSWSTRAIGPSDVVVVTAGNASGTNFLFSATCNPGYGLVPSFSFAAGQQRFEEDFRSLSDVNYRSVGGSLGYQINRALQAGVQVNQQKSSFPNQPLQPVVDPDGPVNSLSALSLSGFGSYLLGTSLNANVTIGWTKSKSDNPLIQEFSGLTGNINLAYSRPTYGATFFFGRNVNLGNVGAANLRIRSSVGLTGSYRLTPQVDLGTGFSYDKDDNRGDIRLGPFVNLGDLQFWRAFASARYRPTSRLALNLGYRYESRAFEEVILDDIPIVLRPPAGAHNVDFGLRFTFR